MNITIEDIKFLQSILREEPGKGEVMKLADEGKTTYEICSILGIALGYSTFTHDLNDKKRHKN